MVGETQNHSSLVGVTQLPVEHLSKMAAEFGQWSPHVCFSFLAEVLQEVHEQVWTNVEKGPFDACISALANG